MLSNIIFSFHISPPYNRGINSGIANGQPGPGRVWWREGWRVHGKHTHWLPVLLGSRLGNQHPQVSLVSTYWNTNLQRVSPGWNFSLVLVVRMRIKINNDKQLRGEAMGLWRMGRESVPSSPHPPGCQTPWAEGVTEARSSWYHWCLEELDWNTSLGAALQGFLSPLYFSIKLCSILNVPGNSQIQ